CMLCGAGDLVGVCKEKIAPNPHQLSPDGKFSWEEVECLGACSNAPMAQIGKDYYEDLTAEGFGDLLDRFAAGEVPRPGPQNGRWASEPLEGQMALTGEIAEAANGSVHLAVEIGETIKRIDGTEPTATTLMRANGGVPTIAKPAPKKAPAPEPEPVAEAPAAPDPAPASATTESAPALLTEARGGQPDDLKRIKGVGPKLEGILHELGVFHFDQIAAWTPAEIAWVDERLKFKGRIERDGWIEQAKSLAGGGA
ncbi:MAG: NAD(P)H-dependent oxidoreductase subunit E, partial [Pseudomonadota bacterium]